MVRSTGGILKRLAFDSNKSEPIVKKSKTASNRTSEERESLRKERNRLSAAAHRVKKAELIKNLEDELVRQKALNDELHAQIHHQLQPELIRLREENRRLLGQDRIKHEGLVACDNNLLGDTNMDVSSDVKSPTPTVVNKDMPPDSFDRKIATIDFGCFDEEPSYVGLSPGISSS